MLLQEPLFWAVIICRPCLKGRLLLGFFMLLRIFIILYYVIMYLNLDSRLSLLIFLLLIAARFLSLYASDLPQPVVRRIWDSALTNW